MDPIATRLIATRNQLTRDPLHLGQCLLAVLACSCSAQNDPGAPGDRVAAATMGLTAASILAQPSFGRVFADVNGDGRRDMVWRFGATIKVAISNGTTFGAGLVATAWSPAFDFQLADVNGDGKADLIGRNDTNIQVALSTGNGSFSPSTAWATWNTSYDHKLADVNGDGKADLVGRSGTVIQVALSSGTQFLSPTQWTTWGTSYDYSLADATGDGKADLVGRSGTDIQVATSTGSSFAASRSWGTWSSGYDYKLADVNGDSKADLVGRSGTSVRVSLSTGAAFGTATQWSTWRTDYDYALADVSGDRKADLVGRSQLDVQVGLSSGSAFATSTQWAGSSPPQAYSYYLNQVDTSRLTTQVYGICAYHRREPIFTDYRGSFTDNLAAAADYIQRQFAALGYTVTREPVYTSHDDNRYCNPPVNGQAYCGDNVIVSKTGSTYPNSYIEFTGHYDGGFGGDDTNGAKDNATAVASVLEMARILATYPSRHSMRFIAFAAEEVYIFAPGSTTHVANARAAGQTIVANLNQDLTGTSKTESGSYFTTIWWKDSGSRELGDYLARVSQANALPLKVYSQLSVESQSDSWPYTLAGFVGATTLGDWTNSGYHTAADTPQNVTYDEVRRVTQANLATGLSIDCGATF
jgi:hypothetical protein